MLKEQAIKLFEKYNPANDIVRCPNGRAQVRKQLDIYAMAAVNIYGIIKRDEFVEIFNSQNSEKTSIDEVYILLLPIIIKNKLYGFYKDYIVNYIVFDDIGWVEYLEGEQAEKPRYIPPKEQFLKFSFVNYEDNNDWHNLRNFMFEAFGYTANVTKAYLETKEYVINDRGLGELWPILSKYSIEFKDEEQVQQFFQMVIHSKNNTRMWENKGHTPIETTKLLTKEQPKEPIISQRKKIGPNQPCPCGSGRKYKHCCKLIEISGAAQLLQNETQLFYKIWYKLLEYVNKKLKVVDYEIEHSYLKPHDESLLLKIRDKLWANPKLISEFVNNDSSLSDEEITLLQSWEKKHIKGRFTLYQYEPEYAVFMQIGEGQTKLFAVKGLSTSIAGVAQRQLPIILETVLLPFADKIIYDGYLASYPINFDVKFKGMFIDEYEKTIDKYGIIKKL